jgi:hypothetical protein
MRTSLLGFCACAAVLLVTGSAPAQSFNVDMGNSNAVPSSTFGAAALQPGVWNQGDATLTSIPLVDLSGNATAVTLTRGPGTDYNFTFNNLSTTGDDELLMDDGSDSTPSGNTYTIHNLSAGTYTVITYAWAPDNPGFQSAVAVNGGIPTMVGGAWPGGYVLGVTHAIDTVTIAAGGTIAVNVAVGLSYCTLNGLQIHKELGPPSPLIAFCFGDGTGTACPCGNSGAIGNGCASSVNAAGGNLAGTGNASITNDTLSLNGSGMSNASALYFQGTTQIAGGLGGTFGDGLRCAGGAVIRLGTKTNVNGASSYPGGSTPISIRGNNAAGVTRHYQCWYRNAAAFCQPETYNLTNGGSVTWTP